MSFFDRVTGNKTSAEDLEVEKAKLVDEKFSTKSFFKLTFNKLGAICKLNFLILLMLSPLVFTLFGYSGSLFGWQFADTALTPSSSVFAHYQGMGAYENGSAFNSLATPFSLLTTINVDNTTTTILKCIGLIVLFTFGPLNVGCTYIMRNMVQEKSVFIWHDFFAAIKKNIKQAFFFGIIDCVCIVAIAYALPFYYYNANSFAMRMLFFAMILIALLYFVMRVYIYLMIVTFDLKYKKLFKNAFILSSAGIKRTLMMLLGVFVVFIISAYIIILLQSFGILLLCVFTIAFMAFLCVYCAYPVIKRYMIDPFYESDGTPKAS